MRKLSALAVVSAAVAFAQPSGYRGEIIKELNGLETRFLKLGEAIPASKYSYRGS